MFMKYTSVTNPRWANAEHTMIDCMVLFDSIGTEIPFGASPDDVEEHGREIFARAAAGEFGPVAEHVPRPPKVPEAVSTRQFYQQLALDGEISLEEAIAAVKTGALPSRFRSLVDSLNGPEKINTVFAVVGSEEVNRKDPAITRIVAELGWSTEKFNRLFTEAAKLK